ncbi:AraC family transcriptional regulator [Arcobacter sp. LA11]|uniref:AraC family transcriptional regulator n=1 Tax=Arcobacter sp. LA11 TaxID=1898176 RepID=UPI0009321D5E|nr:AraC family transcriptional regulator [Arcobacter sp. LA11]
MQKSKILKLKNIGSIQLLEASFTNHSFNKHFHEEFCFGVIQSGKLDFNYRGEKVSANKGVINLCNPGEVHDGFTKDGWAYKMFYVDTKLMRELSSSISGKKNDIPFFKDGVIEDEDLAKRIEELHTIMFDEYSFTIEKEEMFLSVVTQFIKKHADSFIPIEKLYKSKEVIKKSLEYINDNLSSELTVSSLSELANLSLYYFIRVFKEELGLTPKEYILQQRVKKVKELILKGLPLSFIALECGFYDQSHMIKYFKAYTGLNPSFYK